MESDFYDLANQIYSDFCETDGSCSNQLQDAWDKYQDKFGEIEINSEVEKLIIAAMAYALLEQHYREG